MTFSDHFSKPRHDADGNGGRLPLGVLLAMAGGLLVAGLLFAFVLVAEGQVQKAQQRQASQASEQLAIASCVETSQGQALSRCYQRVQAPEPELTPGLEIITLPGTAQTALASPPQGFLSAMFEGRSASAEVVGMGEAGLSTVSTVSNTGR